MRHKVLIIILVLTLCYSCAQWYMAYKDLQRLKNVSQNVGVTLKYSQQAVRAYNQSLLSELYLNRQDYPNSRVTYLWNQARMLDSLRNEVIVHTTQPDFAIAYQVYFDSLKSVIASNNVASLIVDSLYHHYFLNDKWAHWDSLATKNVTLACDLAQTSALHAILQRFNICGGHRYNSFWPVLSPNTIIVPIKQAVPAMVEASIPKLEHYKIKSCTVNGKPWSVELDHAYGHLFFEKTGRYDVKVVLVTINLWTDQIETYIREYQAEAVSF
jgi:hypothetical protein